MPRIRFLASWLKPVLNWNKDEVRWDPNGEVRFLLGRILKILASVLTATEFDMPTFSVNSLVTNVTKVCSDISDSMIHIECQPELVEDGKEERLASDVVFIFPCDMKRSIFLLGFKICILELEQI